MKLVHRPLMARMYCGMCQKWTEIVDGLHCGECGL